MEVKKGDRKYNAQILSAGIIGAVAIGIVVGSVISPASGLATSGAGIIAAVGVAIGFKDGTHAWGNAKEHEADSKIPPAAGLLLVILLAGSILMPRQARADEGRAGELAGTLAIGYAVADLPTHWAKPGTPAWQNALRSFAWGSAVVIVREVIATRSTSNTPLDGERLALGLVGAGLRAGMAWKF